MTKWRSILAATALVLASGTSAFAARTDLVLGMVLEPPHLDPTAGAAAAIDEIVYTNVFEGLTKIGPNGEVEPGLAESWTISDDGKIYTFKLHTGVKFHDGSDFNADDVKFSFERAMAENSVNAQKALFAQIASVEATDPATVTITLKQPQGAFLYNMGWGDAVIVASESADGNKEKPIGTGPFRFDNWARGSSVTLTKSPDYWGEAVALERAEFRFIPDSAAALPALLSGDVQAFANAPVGDALEQVKADTRLKVVVGSTEGETILTMNNKKAPFDNKLVRQAVSYALNREEIIAGATNGLGVPIGSHFAPHNPAYMDMTATYPYDVEKAKALLTEAGVSDLSVTLKMPPPPYARMGGEIIAAELAQVGITVELIPVEWAQWLEQVFTGKDYDLTIISHVEPNDIDIYSRPDYYIGYNNPAFNEVIAKLDATADEGQRKELYGQAQKILSDDAPVGFLFQLPKIGVWDAKLEGMWENMPTPANDLTKVRWTE